MPGRLRDRREVVAALVRGDVLVLGTDTLPGLHCRADLPASVARILALKGRDRRQPFLVLASSSEQVALVTGALSPWQRDACDACWPGPFSLILPAAASLDPAVTAGRPTVAVRVPAPPSLRDLLGEVGFPLVSTSANFSGDEPEVDPERAAALFGDGIDGWWVESDVDSGSTPSALVDLVADRPRLLRPGPVPWPDGLPSPLDEDSPEE